MKMNQLSFCFENSFCFAVKLIQHIYFANFRSLNLNTLSSEIEMGKMVMDSTESSLPLSLACQNYKCLSGYCATWVFFYGKNDNVRNLRTPTDI